MASMNSSGRRSVAVFPVLLRSFAGVFEKFGRRPTPLQDKGPYPPGFDDDPPVLSIDVSPGPRFAPVRPAGGRLQLDARRYWRDRGEQRLGRWRSGSWLH